MSEWTFDAITVGELRATEGANATPNARATEVARLLRGIFNATSTLEIKQDNVLKCRIVLNVTPQFDVFQVMFPAKSVQITALATLLSEGNLTATVRNGLRIAKAKTVGRTDRKSVV